MTLCTKNGITQHIAFSSEDDRAIERDDMHTKICEVWTWDFLDMLMD